MPPEDAVAILARWIQELQTDLADARKTIGYLERRVNGFQFWMATGMTPDDIRATAAELEAV
jgi:hypothetical protein